MDDVPMVPSPPRRPSCCGREPICVGRGNAAGFEVTLVLCMVCHRSQTFRRRIDGQNFWVGAMGRALDEEGRRLTADYLGKRRRGFSISDLARQAAKPAESCE